MLKFSLEFWKFHNFGICKFFSLFALPIWCIKLCTLNKCLALQFTHSYFVCIGKCVLFEFSSFKPCFVDFNGLRTIIGMWHFKLQTERRHGTPIKKDSVISVSNSPKIVFRIEKHCPLSFIPFFKFQKVFNVLFKRHINLFRLKEILQFKV